LMLLVPDMPPLNEAQITELRTTFGARW
jgi:hypothetical protein